MGFTLGQDMARTSTYELHDRLTGGRLGALLLEAKAGDKTMEDIAFELRRDFDLRVSVSTVHRWMQRFEAVPEDAA